MNASSVSIHTIMASLFTVSSASFSNRPNARSFHQINQVRQEHSMAAPEEQRESDRNHC